MWMDLISICGFLTIVMSLAFCLCWRKKRSNSELNGIDGLVIKKEHDENVNHLPSAGIALVDRVYNIHDVSKRATLPTNTKRSLPDIPFEHKNVDWEPTVDNSSEHYASVEQYQNSMKRHTLPNGIETRPSISQQSSLSQADLSPYERVKYDKIKSREHPYAQLQPTTSRGSTLDNKIIAEETGPSQRTEHSLEEDDLKDRSGNDNTLDIPAASAVAGGIAANPDLPYMTPPVLQTNFSGDSQDSSKGYTSISVREPIANILAQTKEITKKRELDPHYSTVSDDSDDVYTTIPDPNQIYTSESETYARIPPGPILVEAEINQCALRLDSDQINEEMYEPAPQPIPPSVDSLKHVTHTKTHTHSRQGSSSSSTANMGSPKPEKRQANSPLPPPPTSGMTPPDGDKKTAAPRNLDDLYAKVQKNKLKTSSDEEKSPEKQFDSTDSGASSSAVDEARGLNLRKKFREHNYETLRKPDCSADPAYDKIKNEEPGYASINGPDSICSSDPGYEVLKENSDPNYEELRHKSSNDSDLESCKVKEANIDSLAGYSVVNKKKKEDNKSRSSSTFGSNSQSQDGSLEEPNYESMPSESISEFQYAGLKSSGSETDPNYESVGNNDPNYESVKDLDEPPYEKVDSDLSRTDSEVPGYERVNCRGYENIDTSESSDSMTNKMKKKPENPYEKLSNAGDCDDGDSLGYAKIKDSSSKTKTSSVESSASVKGEGLANDDVASNNPGDILDENFIFEV